MLHTCNMKLLRRVGLSLSVLLIPALVLNPAPASARVLDPGSPVTSWGNNGVVEHWETGASGDIRITNQDVFEDASGRYVFAATETIGVTETVSVRAISANGTQSFSYVVPESTYDFLRASQFDIDANGRYVIGAYLYGSEEFTVARMRTNGSLDTLFATHGVFNFQTQIDTYLDSLSPGCAGEITVSDLAADPLDSSIYILGSVAPNCTIVGFESSQARLWKLDSTGNIDSTFGTGDLEAFPISGDLNVKPLGDGPSARMKTYDGLTLTVLMTSRNTVNSEDYLELFHQEIDISQSAPTALLQSNGKIYNSSNEQLEELSVIDFDVRYDGKISIVGSENDFGVSGIFLFLDPQHNRWDYVKADSDCEYQSVVVDTNNNTYVSKECGLTDFSYTDSILKYSADGLISSFIGPQGNFGPRSEIDYWRNKLFVDESYVTTIGRAIERRDQAATSLVFGARYHVNALTIPDPPAPAPVAAPAAPAPAPIVAPALPTQSAPVAIAAVVKAKKKISFPLNSAAGNPLIVRVSGSCSLSPVFKTVKVKVGKKTKKVKQQTGWTVQMKKKKQTCTITQTDAGGNGYAPLASTSTVTIK